ncbi:CDK5RAP1-like protein [Anoplophora glabripennis]|uniref:CDK5RAP1-like protein n=1 Tax=Anoplophora glabripennis TaxID=217634 RepID=UPI000873BEF1|nr:CDK5RAP1-like protein [Anoplophora glabripennis]
MHINTTVLNTIPLVFKGKFSKKIFNYRLGLRKLSCTRIYRNIAHISIENESEGKDTTRSKFRHKLLNGPNLKDFFKNEHLSDQENLPEEQVVPYLQDINRYTAKRKVYFDVYGCQMNVNDTEIIWAILKDNKFERTKDVIEADVILIVTCAIRDSAEERIWARLNFFKGIRRMRLKDRPSLKIGLLGCMAERLKEKVLERDCMVDVVAGPDSYRDLPRLLALTESNQRSVNVLLSLDETYADITPVRLNEDSVSAFVSIMRGCDNMCTYCIVPFTRGRERSRPASSILREVEQLSEQGVKEVTLLGQNVNSYRDLSEGHNINNFTSMAKGFKTVYKVKKGGLRFADLLHKVAHVNPEMRIRFTSPHPKDFPDEVIQTIQSHSNICKNLHMPAQSGNSAVLERMRRGYTREAYIELVQHIRHHLPQVALSSDFICGFCGETVEEFEDTITLMEEVQYNTAYLFPYSMREKTTAHRRFKDDVSPEIKQKRLERMIQVFRQIALKLNRTQIGKTHLVLVEGYSRRSKNFLKGRNDQNIRVILPANETVPFKNGGSGREIIPGDYVAVHVNDANSQVLKAIPLYLTNLQDFYLEDRHQRAIQI